MGPVSRPFTSRRALKWNQKSAKKWVKKGPKRGSRGRVRKGCLNSKNRENGSGPGPVLIGFGQFWPKPVKNHVLSSKITKKPVFLGKITWFWREMDLLKQALRV